MYLFVKNIYAGINNNIRNMNNGHKPYISFSPVINSRIWIIHRANRLQCYPPTPRPAPGTQRP